jgi:hypothetical protein
MKKLLLLVAVLLATNVNAQFSESGCGWVFKSSEVCIGGKGIKPIFRTVDTKISYNTNCKGHLYIEYPNGSIDKYYFNSTSPKSTGYNNDGDYYEVYVMYDYSTGKRTDLQIVKGSEAYVRLLSSGYYTELSI